MLRHASSSTRSLVRRADGDFTEGHRWLLLALQLPARPSNARVKTWRRLQQLGAVALKGSLYVLPRTPQALEDFEWLRAEVESLNGQANVFAASTVGGLNDRQVVEHFREARDLDYRAFLKAVRAARSAVKRRSSDDRVRALNQLSERLDTIRKIDFFHASQREQAEQAYATLARDLRPTEPSARATSSSQLDTRDYQQRTWVTRFRPGVDRLSSAWLISRFIDREPNFEFAADPETLPEAIPFDMFGAGFCHEGGRCTFEVLQERFGIVDPAVTSLAQIIHDLDLKDERFRPPQAAGIATTLEGLSLAFSDDAELMKQGIALFEAIYLGLRAGHNGKTIKRRVTE